MALETWKSLSYSALSLEGAEVLRNAGLIHLVRPAFGRAVLAELRGHSYRREAEGSLLL